MMPEIKIEDRSMTSTPGQKLAHTSRKTSTDTVKASNINARSVTAMKTEQPSGSDLPSDKSGYPVILSDDRDEQGQQLKQRSKAQPRAPPSPLGDSPRQGIRVRRELKYRSSPTSLRSDHPSQYQDESASFLLFTHSFDTISENGDYLREFNQPESYAGGRSPVPHGLTNKPNPPTPRIEIAIPELGHSGSEGSFADVSPIKVVHRHAAAATHKHSPYAAARAPYPPRHIAQTPTTPAMRMTYGRGPGSNSRYPSAANRQYEYDYYWRQRGYPAEEHVSNPFYVIRSCQRAFLGCTYLLSCLRDPDVISVNLNRYGHIRRYQGNPQVLDPDSMELIIATRRIETAICAFGGSTNPRRPSHASSIFRLRDTAPTKQHYEQRLSQRYHLTEGRISWEVEANPPIDLEPENTDQADPDRKVGTRKGGNTKNTPHIIADDSSSGKRTSRTGSSSPTPSACSADGPKMKYRCKLCGQLKQNHNCTFRQSLQREIGVQVFAAVNAYTASEPGYIAPALSKMNNFVSYDFSGQTLMPSPALMAGEEGLSHNTASLCHPSTVTPQSVRESGVHIHSPQSSLSTHSQEMSPDGILPHSSGGSDNAGSGSHYHVHFSQGSGAPPRDRKRSHSQFMERHTKLVHHKAFVPSLSLRPEHYRAVTPFREEESANGSTAGRNGSNRASTGGSYHYPTVPLTFAERKRMSDTLFYFSREVPGMTNDCAAVLRDARENGDWDQAVAELLTQIIVGLYCGEGDSQLDGLKHYLLSLGVSC